jgi:predicted nucleotidyltransferase
MKYTELLNYIFDSSIKVKILRFLVGSSDDSRYSGREVAAALKISPTTANKLLNELCYLKILNKKILRGTHLYCYNYDHYFVKEIILPAFKKERKINITAGKFVVPYIKNDAVSIIVFGSSARNEDTPDSDFDICIIVKNKKLKSKVENSLNEIAHDFWLNFGKYFSPYILTVKEFQEKFNKKMGVIKNIVKEGIVIEGLSPKIIIVRGKKNERKKN